MKTAIEQLKERIEKDVKENGLLDAKVTLSDTKGYTAEQVAQEILDILDADAKGLCKPYMDY